MKKVSSDEEALKEIRQAWSPDQGIRQPPKKRPSGKGRKVTRIKGRSGLK